MYCSFANIGHADTMCSTVSSNYLPSLHLLPASVCNILFADVWFLMPDLVLLLFHCQSLLADIIIIINIKLLLLVQIVNLTNLILKGTNNLA